MLELVESDEIPEISENTEISEMSIIDNVPVMECSICLDNTGIVILFDHCMPVYMFIKIV